MCGGGCVCGGVFDISCYCCHSVPDCALWWSSYICDHVQVYVMCMFCIVFNLCAKFELVKSPEVTLSG